MDIMGLHAMRVLASMRASRQDVVSRCAAAGCGCQVTPDLNEPQLADLPLAGRRCDIAAAVFAGHRDRMADGVAHLASIIAAHLREWDRTPAFVEQAIFASEDARGIAAAIDALCEGHLGANVAGGLFYQSSIGSVAGVALSDGRKVVIKTH